MAVIHHTNVATTANILVGASSARYPQMTFEPQSNAEVFIRTKLSVSLSRHQLETLSRLVDSDVPIFETTGPRNVGLTTLMMAYTTYFAMTRLGSRCVVVVPEHRMIATITKRLRDVTSALGIDVVLRDDGGVYIRFNPISSNRISTIEIMSQQSLISRWAWTNDLTVVDQANQMDVLTMEKIKTESKHSIVYSTH